MPAGRSLLHAGLAPLIPFQRVAVFSGYISNAIELISSPPTSSALNLRTNPPCGKLTPDTGFLGHLTDYRALPQMASRRLRLSKSAIWLSYLSYRAFARRRGDRLLLALQAGKAYLLIRCRGAARERRTAGRMRRPMATRPCNSLATGDSCPRPRPSVLLVAGHKSYRRDWADPQRMALYSPSTAGFVAGLGSPQRTQCVRENHSVISHLVPPLYSWLWVCH